MSYIVLARKWRPQTFDGVVGQTHVTRALKNAVAQGRLAHALLFTGSRGVGKTTTARIVAKALNCDGGPTPDPCNACSTCAEITAGRSMDCLEIDGASNRGIDEVRELRETVRYAPSRGKHRVIIIDEVHMVTEPAFNALLKTLEEPPPRVVFILATTDPQKVPATIQSRCQRHDFRRLGSAEIVGRLREIALDEKIRAGDDVLALIAGAAAGSLRDAESLLDQAIAYCGEEVTREGVAATLGLVDAAAIEAASEALLARNAGRVLETIDDLAGRGADLRGFCLELLAHFRNVLVAKVSPRAEALLGASRLDPSVVRAQAEGVGLPELELMLRALAQAEADMRRASQPRFALELALVRAAEVRRLVPLAEVVERLAKLEARLGSEAGPPGPADLPLFSREPAAPPPPPREPAPPRGGPSLRPGPTVPRPPAGDAGEAEEAPREAAPEASSPEGTDERWARVRQGLRDRKRLASVLEHVAGVAVEGDTLVVRVSNGTPFIRQTLEERENRRLLVTAVAEAFGRQLKVEYRFETAGPGGGQEARPPAAGPARRPQDHPAVRDVLEIFEGELLG